MEDLHENDHMAFEQGKKIPKYPTKEWVIARSVTPEIGKNAESTNSSKDRITNNDVTSHVNIAKYVDTANTDEHNREVYTNIDYKQGKKDHDIAPKNGLFKRQPSCYLMIQLMVTPKLHMILWTLLF